MKKERKIFKKKKMYGKRIYGFLKSLTNYYIGEWTWKISQWVFPFYQKDGQWTRLCFLENGEIYRLCLSRRRGPQRWSPFVKAINDKKEDVTDILREYWGPSNDCFGQVYTPNHFGWDVVEIHYLNSMEEVCLRRFDRYEKLVWTLP